MIDDISTYSRYKGLNIYANTQVNVSVVTVSTNFILRKTSEILISFHSLEIISTRKPITSSYSVL